MNRLAQEIEAALKGVRGSQDVLTLTNEGVQYLKVDIDRFQAGHRGLSVVDIEDDLRSQLEGVRWER